MTRGPNAPRIPYLDGTPRRRIQSHGISCCSSWLAWKRFFADAFYADDWRVDISAQAASFGPEPLLVRLHHLASSLLHRPLPLSGTPSPCFLPEPFHKRRRKCTLCDQVEIFSLFQQSLTHMSNASNSHTPKYIQTHSLRLAKSQYTRERLRASLHRSQRHCMPLEKSRLHIRT